jgi:putative membrane protein
MRLTTAGTAPLRGDFRRNRFLQALVGLYAGIWILLAIDPLNRTDWLLENALTVMFVAGLAVTYARFAFSDFSYLLIFLFMTLHAIGAHYTYAEVPLGYWLKGALGLSRNHFDRIVHFAFGLLLAYPIRELLLRQARVHTAWSYALAVTLVQACSDLFEIIESWVAQTVSPELGSAYLGTQGDERDAQKDMTAAFAGAVIAALAMFAAGRLFQGRSSRFEV